jgi:hypothetical protein
VAPLTRATQALLVLAVWLGAVPLTTCWLWRLVFAQSLRAGVAALKARCAPLLLLADCLYGSVLSAGIVFTILAVSSLRDHLRAVRPSRARRSQQRFLFWR